NFEIHTSRGAELHPVSMAFAGRPAFTQLVERTRTAYQQGRTGGIPAQISFSLSAETIRSLKLPGLKTDPLASSPFPLRFAFEQTANGLGLEVHYAAEAFK